MAVSRTRSKARSIPIDKPDTFNYTRFEPLGVVGAIMPWNSPLLLTAWKLAPALAAGNTMVFKPSEYTSASLLEFMKLVEQAGFPPGVVNVVTGFGPEAGTPLVEHPLVAKIAFTGSDVTGQKIYEAAAKGLKRVSMELGGKSPNIVFDDAEIDNAVKGAISGIFAAMLPIVEPEAYYLTDHQIIYALVHQLYEANRPIDAVILREELSKRGQLDEIGGTAYLAELLNTVPSAANCMHGTADRSR